MDKNSNFGQLFEQGKAAMDDSASSVVDTTKKQILGNKAQNSQSPTAPNIQNKEVQAQLSEDAREIVKDFYEPSSTSQDNQVPSQDDSQEKLAKVRKELQQFQNSLHQTNYYEPLFAYEKKKKEKRQAVEQEEAVVEQKKMTELNQQQRKKEDLARFRAQRSVEIKGGIVG
ncbi:MAG: hypothetical protein A2798_03255 [Candidatus Levybacteria bacterium RIFCSPHIGHO2_01_FULL_37_17]|nr:MAG: hypothetical protein A2798_03255 [Candidatus Levybacteria bacterium RIFCSPHIGHO2_01_FULL_37_17]OGH36872.1 MAG: hypothetical protein A2959_01245 [Candidatus Levybacteria bacterium RIFCSPLOWO2_01_FULL_38_23]